jgi:5-methyltetrahydropteroyltriglutamate--homocysteine methyltransferase
LHYDTALKLTVAPIHHADVVGSMLRPHYLVDARNAMYAAGASGDQEAIGAAAAGLREAEDRAIDEAVLIQENAGLDVVTDGEMRRATFFDFFSSGMSGLAMMPGSTVRFVGQDGAVAMEVVVPFTVTEKVTARTCPGVEEFRYTRSRTEADVKVCLPSPLLMMANFWNDNSRDAYPDPFDLAIDARDAIVDWMRELADAGCTNIQLDAPELATAYADERFREEDLRSRGIDPERFLTLGTELIASLGAVDLPGVSKTMHVCKGNGTQSWIGTGGYDAFAEHVFNEAGGFDVYHLEYDDERSGDFSPLGNLPDEKVAVLGLVSTKWVALEDREMLQRRIEDAARFHPIEHLAVATQCGFASAAETAEDRKVTYDTQVAKLGLVADVAHEVWGGDDGEH